MDWRKKTDVEIDHAVAQGDSTGGYDFLPWVWHMRKFMFFAFLLNIFMGYKAYEGYLEYGKETVTLVASIFFGIVVPVVIGGMLFREHREKKKGISK